MAGVFLENMGMSSVLVYGRVLALAWISTSSISALRVREVRPRGRVLEVERGGGSLVITMMLSLLGTEAHLLNNILSLIYEGS